MIPEMNIISRKASVASINGTLESGGAEPPKNFLNSKEQLYYLKIDLNAAKIITVQD